MTAVDDRPAVRVTDIWLDALKFHAHGITPEGLRKLAARVTGEECSLVLGIAGAMEQLAAQGMTPEQAYNLAGMDRVLGPYMSPDRAVHIAAEYMTLADGRPPACPRRYPHLTADAVRFRRRRHRRAGGTDRRGTATTPCLVPRSPRPPAPCSLPSPWATPSTAPPRPSCSVSAATRKGSGLP